MLSNRIIMSANQADSGIGGNDANTVLLLSCDGDEGATGHTITINGTPVLDSQDSPFTGTQYGSILFDGSTDYLTMPDSANWDIVGSTSQDYTLDGWVKLNAHSGADYLFDHYVDANDHWIVYHQHSLGIVFTFNVAGLPVVALPAGGEITDSNWHHIAVIKKCTAGPTVEWGVYKDGIQVVYSSDNSTGNIAGLLTIGRYGGASGYMDGNLADVRISNTNVFGAAPNVGITDTFVIPTSPAVANVNTLLLIRNYANKAIGAAAAHQVTVANTGLVIAQEAPSALWKQSYHFDGSTDFLTAPTSADYDVFGSTSQDYTIDFWVKLDVHTGNESIIRHYEDANNWWGIRHVHGAGMRLSFVSVSDETAVVTGAEITDTNWHHYAIVKVTSAGPTVEWGVYKNGVQAGYASFDSIDTFTGTLIIGQSGASTEFMDGYLDEIRIQKSNWFQAAPNVGETDTITVPAGPYTVA